MNDWFVYIVECADGTLYTGISNEVEKRVADHNNGRGAKYTRGRRPVVLKYIEKTDSKSEALKKEYEIKHLSKKDKEGLFADFENGL